jgi:hypothetical protein
MGKVKYIQLRKSQGGLVTARVEEDFTREGGIIDYNYSFSKNSGNFTLKGRKLNLNGETNEDHKRLAKLIKANFIFSNL